MFRILVSLALLLLASACNSGPTTFRHEAQGAPYEVVVVASHDVWKGAAGDSLRSTFYRQFPGVNRQETTFDVLRVLPHDFKKTIARHRNVLITRVDTAATESKIALSNDVYARPQTVVTLTASSLSALENLVNTTREDVMLLFEKAEKDRDVANAASHTPPKIAELIRSKFGFELSVGPGYTVRSESDDFLWLSYEMPTASQGVVIYTYPFSGSPDLTQKALIARRNEFVGRIPGENPGSRMSTYSENQVLEYKTIDERSYAQTRGFWRVEGDFMGGPFTNFSTYDEVNGRIVAIDFYVYAPDPRSSQRNYIRQLEHLIYTVRMGKNPFSAKL